MKRVFLSLTIVVALALGANAQKSSSSSEGEFKFAGGLRLGLPLGDFGDTQGFGIGGELQGEYMFSPMVSATITSGYTSFTGKDYTVPGFGTFKGSSVGFIPIMAGARVYPSTSFFAGGKLGLGIFTGSGSSSSGFSYEPQVGYNAEKFQLAVGYNGWSKNGGTLSHLGLSALYKFN